MRERAESEIFIFTYENRISEVCARRGSNAQPTAPEAIPGISPNVSRHRAVIRSFNSAAALSVNVNATMFPGFNPDASSLATRLATTSVFPEPAHAIN